MSKNILFVSSIKTHFLEFKRYYTYSYPNIKNEYKLILLFNFYYNSVSDDIEFCKNNNITYLINFKNIQSLENNENTNDISINNNFIFTFLRIIKWLLYYKILLKRINKVYKTNKIKLLVICEDNISYGLNLYVTAAKNNNIQTLIFPFTIPNSIEFLEQIKNIDTFKFYRNNILHKIIKRHYSNWITSFQSNNYFKAPIWQILSLELLNIAPKSPWISFNEDLTTVAVESDFMMKHYIKYGISKERLVLTGSLIDDKMFEVLNYNLKNDNISRLTILCAFPPPQLHHNSGYKSYDELVNDLINSFKPLLSGHNVVFKMHPRVERKTIDLLLDSGFNVSNRETFELIASCDIYIAFISATIRWALNLNIPIINFDIYNYNYNDFQSIDNVHNVFDITQFRYKLNELINVHNINNKNCDIIMDGNSCLRINNLILKLINASN